MNPVIGPAIVGVTTPVEKCGEACLANPECHHFTYTRSKGLCILLKKTNLRFESCHFSAIER
jgi:hypothetical protein